MGTAIEKRQTLGMVLFRRGRNRNVLPATGLGIGGFIEWWMRLDYVATQAATGFPSVSTLLPYWWVPLLIWLVLGFVLPERGDPAPLRRRSDRFWARWTWGMLALGGVSAAASTFPPIFVGQADVEIQAAYDRRTQSGNPSVIYLVRVRNVGNTEVLLDSVRVRIQPSRGGEVALDCPTPTGLGLIVVTSAGDTAYYHSPRVAVFRIASTFQPGDSANLIHSCDIQREMLPDVVAPNTRHVVEFIDERGRVARDFVFWPQGSPESLLLTWADSVAP